MINRDNSEANYLFLLSKIKRQKRQRFNMLILDAQQNEEVILYFYDVAVVVVVTYFQVFMKVIRMAQQK